MATEQDGPSYFDMLRGDGDPWQVALARGGGLILLFVILTAVLALN